LNDTRAWGDDSVGLCRYGCCCSSHGVASGSTEEGVC
jgi:hypothetical protein